MTLIRGKPDGQEEDRTDKEIALKKNKTGLKRRRLD